MSDFIEAAGVRLPIADGAGGVRVVTRPFSSRTPYDALELGEPPAVVAASELVR